MTTINKVQSPTFQEVNIFKEKCDFKLPSDFVKFFEESNGGEIIKDEHFIILWPLTEMIQLNKDYKVNEYAPDFFIFGSDGADMAFAIEKATGYFFEVPFIGMSREEAIFICKSFTDLIK